MKTIQLFYFDTVPNFGDLLNRHILEKIFNVKVEHANSGQAEMVAIGSMLEEFLWNNVNSIKFLIKKNFRLKPLLVYGTGFIAEPHFKVKRPNGLPEIFFRRMIPCALRGKLTQGRMETILHKNYDSLPLGDPGLLASLLIDSQPVVKKYSMGIIPHYVNKSHPKMEQLAALNDHSVIIDIQAEPLEVLRQIAQCETIVSTAMHGLIAADALGIPNQWIMASNEIYGNNYKFRDYYSVFGQTPEPLDLNTTNPKHITPQTVADAYKIQPADVKHIQTALLKAFRAP